MQIPEEEIKRVKKTLILNLVVADVVIITGLLIYFKAGHKFEMVGFYATVLGMVWILMTAWKLFKFNKFLRENDKKE